MINLKQRETIRDLVLATAISLAHSKGPLNVSRRKLCEEAGIPEGSFTFYTGCHFRDYMCTIISNMDRLPLQTSQGSTRVHPNLRMAVILGTAKTLHRNMGIDNITLRELASICEVSPSLIQYYFGNMTNLREEVKNQE